ncbi:MAG TPA: DNA-binding domain-containing protein, partial [Azospirillaceae bacterium]|nr:DNA-binding domain-containing protein [Azospirillaceae bacterium]
RRIAVHRNTYFGSLTEALAAAYPVTEKLTGAAFFALAARAFIDANPPTKPDLAAYGGDFGDFLDAFPPAASVPYLGDVARLEWARVEATFAAEAEPLDPAALALVPPDQIAGLVFAFHPSARLVQCRWAAHSVWLAHREDPPVPVDPAAGPETVLLVRPADRMLTERLGQGEAALIAALMTGQSLGGAAAEALAAAPGLDLTAALARLLRMGAIIAFQ